MAPFGPRSGQTRVEVHDLDEMFGDMGGFLGLLPHLLWRRRWSTLLDNRFGSITRSGRKKGLHSGSLQSYQQEITISLYGSLSPARTRTAGYQRLAQGEITIPAGCEDRYQSARCRRRSNDGNASPAGDLYLIVKGSIADPRFERKW